MGQSSSHIMRVFFAPVKRLRNVIVNVPTNQQLITIAFQQNDVRVDSNIAFIAPDASHLAPNCPEILKFSSLFFYYESTFSTRSSLLSPANVSCDYALSMCTYITPPQTIFASHITQHKTYTTIDSYYSVCVTLPIYIAA